MLKPLVTAFAALVLLAAPVVALDGPEQTVRRVYDADSLPTTAQGSNALLARDMSAAYQRDLKMDEPQPSTDFDWRYGNQDYDVSELSIARGVSIPSVGGVTMMDVSVSFKDFNKPQTVVWRMCLASKGWRVADVRGANPDGTPWSLREMMKLPADKVKC